MKKLLLLSFVISGVLLNTSTTLFWGQIGHRTVGLIAEGLVKNKTQRAIKRVLGNETLAEVSTYMDEVRSDSSFNYANTWHYCTIPDGMTYEEAPTQEGGDVVWAIEKMIKELKAGGLTPEEEAIKLKFLIHMVGDIHQPLHVGTGEDRGGNDVRVQWFGSNTNLHSVWDSKMINAKEYSYTEFTDWINHPSKNQIKKWQSASVRDWAHESMTYRPQIYDVPENGRLSYVYSYQYFDIVKLRLFQAGVRLAGVLNDIYA